MGMTKDVNTRLRSSSDGVLDSTEILTVFDLRKTPIRGMALEVIVPAAAGATSDPATLDVVPRGASSSNPDSTEIVGGAPQISAAGEYIVPFNTDKRYLEVALILGGTSPDFSNVQVWIVQQSQNWGRDVDFSS
jgi:hypothetical protein